MRLAVIDDHPLVRDAVAMLVASIAGNHASRGFETLESFESDHAAGSRYDLVLLDLGLPGFAGLEALETYRARHEDTPVVVLSALCDQTTILEALDLGAMGFIPKTSRREVLVSAIELVASGGIYVPPEALARTGSTGSAATPAARPATSPADEQRGMGIGAGLTLRQREVLNLLIKGLPNKLICRELDLSANTVKSHLSAIFRVLDVTNRTQAVIAAQRLGIRVRFGPADAGASERERVRP